MEVLIWYAIIGILISGIFLGVNLRAGYPRKRILYQTLLLIVAYPIFIIVLLLMVVGNAIDEEIP